jgi:tetratricopeptide (TPR) repeat protein
LIEIIMARIRGPFFLPSWWRCSTAVRSGDRKPAATATWLNREGNHGPESRPSIPLMESRGSRLVPLPFSGSSGYIQPDIVKLGKNRAKIDATGHGAPQSPLPSIRSRPIRRHPGWTIIIGLAALAGFVALDEYFRPGAPMVEVPVPVDLDRLDPQLRAYIAEKVRWVREKPSDARREATLGMVYAANALWKEALVAFQNTARLKPGEPLAQLYIGVATLELGNLPSAQKVFHNVTARFPDFAPGFYRLGDASLRLGVVPEAETSFQRLIALAPREWRGYAGLAEVRMRQSRFAEAAQLLEKALLLDPTAKNAHHLLGLAYRGLGRMAEAQRELGLGTDAISYPMPDAWSVTARQHMKLLPDQFEMAEDYARAGTPIKGVLLLQTALSYHPGDATVMNNLAVAYLRSGQPDQARSLALQIVHQDDRNQSALLTLSTSCASLGLTNDALTYATRAVEMAPDTAAAHMAEANALLGMERDLAAVAGLQAALRCDPKSVHIHNQLGDVLLRNLKRPEEALKHYQQASQLDPTSVAGFVRLTDVYLRLNKPEAARQTLAQARALAPNEPVMGILEERLRKLTQP